MVHDVSSILFASLDFGFVAISDDKCFLRYPAEGDIAILACIYVDDSLLAFQTDALRLMYKSALRLRFPCTFVDRAYSFLGWDLFQDTVTFQIQDNHISSIKRFLMTQPSIQLTRPVQTPLELNVRFFPADSSIDADPRVITLYRADVGYINWLAQNCCPYLLYPVSQIARLNAHPEPIHIQAVDRVKRFLATNLDLSQHFGYPNAVDLSHNLDLYVYADASFCAPELQSRSMAGYLTRFLGSVISARCSKISKVAQLAMEAEFYSASQAGNEIVYLWMLVQRMGYEQLKPTALLEDNQAAIAISENPVFRNRSKHINMRRHLIRQYIEDKILEFEFCPSHVQGADLVTKAVTVAIYKILLPYYNVW